MNFWISHLRLLNTDRVSSSNQVLIHYCPPLVLKCIPWSVLVCSDHQKYNNSLGIKHPAEEEDAWTLIKRCHWYEYDAGSGMFSLFLNSSSWEHTRAETRKILLLSIIRMFSRNRLFRHQWDFIAPIHSTCAFGWMTIQWQEHAAFVNTSNNIVLLQRLLLLCVPQY